MIANSTIDAVRDLPIQEVVGKYMGSDLKKAGASWKGCCPLPNHREKTPSFHVTPVKNLFKCFGCGAGGDAISFVMQVEGATFYEAVKSIAGQHGIEVQESDDERTSEQKRETEIALDLLAMASEKYVQSLYQTRP